MILDMWGTPANESTFSAILLLRVIFNFEVIKNRFNVIKYPGHRAPGIVRGTQHKSTKGELVCWLGHVVRMSKEPKEMITSKMVEKIRKGEMN